MLLQEFSLDESKGAAAARLKLKFGQVRRADYSFVIFSTRLR
jgi:hypothetical protein